MPPESPRLFGTLLPRGSGSKPCLQQLQQLQRLRRSSGQLFPRRANAITVRSISEFLARFKAGKEYGKMNDQETHYREVVFTMWNINGVKYPAVFRP